MSPPWYIGATINVIGNIAINLGQNLMKLGHNKRAELDAPEDKKPSIIKFPAWQWGIFIFTVGTVANFVSFGFAAQSLLAALGSIQFVAQLVFGYFVAKEKVTWLLVAGNVAIVGGCLILVIFGDHTVVTYTVDQLKELYSEAPYIVYLVMAFLFAFGCYIVYLHGKSVLASVSEHPELRNSCWVQILPIAYSIFAALIGTQSVVFAKSLSTLLVETFKGNNQMGNWYTWVTFLVFIISAAFWTIRLNKGIRMFPAMVIVPLLQICWVLLSTISGLLYFQEYANFDALTASMFALGMLVVIFGVYLITLSNRLQALAQELEEMSEGSDDKDIMSDNPVFEGHGHPQADLNSTAHVHRVNSATSIPFMGLAGTIPVMATCHNSTITSGRTKRNLHSTAGGRSNLNNTHNSQTLNSTARSKAGSERDDNSMMGTIRKALMTDFSLYDKDLVKQGVSSSEMLALNVFAVPASHNASHPKKRSIRRTDSSGGGDQGPPHPSEHIVSALPESRFFNCNAKSDIAKDHLETIRETSSNFRNEASHDVSSVSSQEVKGPDRRSLQSVKFAGISQDGTQRDQGPIQLKEDDALEPPQHSGLGPGGSLDLNPDQQLQLQQISPAVSSPPTDDGFIHRMKKWLPWGHPSKPKPDSSVLVKQKEQPSEVGLQQIIINEQQQKHALSGQVLETVLETGESRVASTVQPKQLALPQPEIQAIQLQVHQSSPFSQADYQLEAPMLKALPKSGSLHIDQPSWTQSADVTNERRPSVAPDQLPTRIGNDDWVPLPQPLVKRHSQWFPLAQLPGGSAAGASVPAAFPSKTSPTHHLDSIMMAAPPSIRVPQHSDVLNSETGRGELLSPSRHYTSLLELPINTSSPKLSSSQPVQLGSPSIHGMGASSGSYLSMLQMPYRDYGKLPRPGSALSPSAPPRSFLAPRAVLGWSSDTERGTGRESAVGKWPSHLAPGGNTSIMGSMRAGSQITPTSPGTGLWSSRAVGGKGESPSRLGGISNTAHFQGRGQGSDSRSWV